MRLENKIAIVTGAGQTPGDTMGNGRATALLFAREGAQVLLTDRDQESVEETQKLIHAAGGNATVLCMDVSSEQDCIEMVSQCVNTYGRIDILHNNVGIGRGDSGVTSLTEENWHKIINVNLTSMFLTCKHTLPVMRDQQSGCVINISSVAAIASTGLLAYKTSKAGVIALTENVAMGNAKYGIRANCITPGLMNTPMAIEGYAASQGKPKDEVIAARDRMVPLNRKMGTALDVANAAVFLASEEASFITGATLPVDGGQSIRIG